MRCLAQDDKFLRIHELLTFLMSMNIGNLINLIEQVRFLICDNITPSCSLFLVIDFYVNHAIFFHSTTFWLSCFFRILDTRRFEHFFFLQKFTYACVGGGEKNRNIRWKQKLAEAEGENGRVKANHVFPDYIVIRF